MTGKPTYKDLEQRILVLEEESIRDKQAQLELRQSETKYRLLVDNSHDLIWTLSAASTVTYVSPSWQRIMGYEPSAIIGKPLQNIVHPDDVARSEEYIRQAIRSKERITGAEYRVKHADGTWQWQEAGCTPVFGSDGSFLYTVGISRDVTGRNLAEDALRESEERYRTILENIADGYFESDLAGNLTFFNDSACKVTGYSPDELLGMNNRQFTDKETARKVSETFNKVYTTGKAANAFEWKLITKEGAERFVESSISVKRDREGRPTGFQCIARDITNRRQAEDELKESRQQLSDIINFLPDATFVIDKEGRVIAWNRALEAMTGIKAADMLDKGNYEYALPFYGERRPMLIDLALKPREEIEVRYVTTQRGNEVLEGEAYMPALGGGEVYLYGNAGILRDSKGDIVGAIESIRDITDRRRAEEAVLESEERFRLIAENARVVIWMMDMNLRYKYISPYIKHNLGYTPEEYIAKPLNEVLTPSSLELCMNLFAEELEKEKKPGRDTSRSMTIECDYIHKDGRIIPAEMNMTFIRDAAGNAEGILGITGDITERKFLESQLRQAQKMESIGTLAGGIAHDFNNILSAVIGYAEMARKEPDISDRLQRYLEQIYKAGTRAGELVKQILTFSRRNDDELYPLRISPIVKEVLKLIRATLPATIEISQNIQTDPDTVLANSTRIHQILMNLCTNAAQAMGAGKGTLQVVLAPIEIKPDDVLIHHGLIPGRHIKLSVCDTGQGIAPEIMDKIFDPFFTTKRSGVGTGMGLSVVHGIVKGCGGTITAQSEVGKGTEFNVYFPLLMETERKKQEGAPPPLFGGEEHILLVDDEAAIVDIGKEMLTGLGYKVLGMTNSPKALELFRISPDRFDLVITDMTMPDMTGSELARELMLIRPDIPVILCTGFSELITKDQAKSLGIRNFIVKPVGLKQIAAIVRRVLDRKE